MSEPAPLPPDPRLLRFAGARAHAPEIDAWLAARRGPLGELARHWFARLRQCGVGVRELLHDGHPTACLGDAAFAYVNVFSQHINLGFFRGAELADPNRLLSGSGRNMRHVKLSPGNEPDAEALQALIEQAFADISRRLHDQP